MPVQLVSDWLVHSGSAPDSLLLTFWLDFKEKSEFTGKVTKTELGKKATFSYEHSLTVPRSRVVKSTQFSGWVVTGKSHTYVFTLSRNYADEEVTEKPDPKTGKMTKKVKRIPRQSVEEITAIFAGTPLPEVATEAAAKSVASGPVGPEEDEFVTVAGSKA